MTQCQNCGQANTDESHFCRFCGHRFAGKAPQTYDMRPPRPYAWKTDEYQTQAEARVNAPLMPHHGSSVPGSNAQSVMQTNYRGPQDLAGNYRCPFCGTNFLPVIERRVSTAGWITFALLLIFTLVFFWIGLLIREDVHVCPVCRRQVS